MRKVVVGLLIYVGIICQSAYSEENEDGSVLLPTNMTETVTKESYMQLKAENDALRRENQMLRRELVAKNGMLPDSLLPEKVVATEVKVAPRGEDTGYWLAQKSKIRHNKKCRNYRKVKGRPCRPNDGKPCKMCGG